MPRINSSSLYFPGSNQREENLFHLIRTSCRLGSKDEIRRYGECFEKSFPNSPRLKELRPMLWSALFEHGGYAECIELCAPLVAALGKSTPEHDACLYFLGASCFHTGQYDKAGPLLDEHAAMYPENAFAVPTAYFRAANRVRLQSWKDAAALLDAFIAAHPDANDYLPFALYDRAVCHKALGEVGAALALTTRLIAGFPDAPVIEQACLLQGGLLEASGRTDEAESGYAKALEIAERRRNRAVAGEALYRLIDLAKPAQARTAVAHADLFWKEYAADSPYKAQVAVAQVPAFTASGRGEEALSRLSGMIVETAAAPDAPGIRELVNAYTAAYLGKHGPEELREHYRKFPGILADDKRVRPLLRVAVIGAFEEAAATSSDAGKPALAATIKELFQELKTEFAAQDLADFILVRIGDYLRLKTSTPREALPYYDEVLKRPAAAGRFAALLGRADVYAASGAAADLEKALADFKRVAEESADGAERDHALGRVKELQDPASTK